jgi:riboflavin synthase
VFTGIVEEVGALVSRSTRGPGARLFVRCSFAPLVLGESISVSGACLTVDEIVRDGFAADASSETLSRTTLGALPLPAPVNLERALMPTSRLGGHLVGGHVDAVARIESIMQQGESHRFELSLPPEIAHLVAAKGSIAVDGVSLTVNEVSQDRFSFVMIPHTFANTTLAHRKVSDLVNVEADVLARYVARQLERPRLVGAESHGSDERLMNALLGAGYLEPKG